MTHAAPQAPTSSALDYIGAVTKKWRWVIGVGIGSFVLALGIQLLMPNWYTARTSFVAESRGASRIPANLAGLASQFGVDVGGEPARSPNFYASIVLSEPILNNILTSRFPRRGAAPSDSVTLLDRFDIDQREPARRLELGRRMLRKLISVGADPRTTIITLEVEAKDPVLAAAIANRFVAELSRFDIGVRQSQARTRRDFAAREAEEVRQDLLSAEESLRRFLERNREYRSSPALTFEEGRLRRHVDLQQELYLSVRRELESAKIAAVNDAPAITVLSPAEPPVRKSRPHRLAASVAAGLLGGIAAVVWLTLRHHLATLRQRDPEQWDGIFTFAPGRRAG